MPLPLRHWHAGAHFVYLLVLCESSRSVGLQTNSRNGEGTGSAFVQQAPREDSGNIGCRRRKQGKRETRPQESREGSRTAATCLRCPYGREPAGVVEEIPDTGHQTQCSQS